MYIVVDEIKTDTAEHVAWFYCSSTTAVRGTCASAAENFSIVCLVVPGIFSGGRATAAIMTRNHFYRRWGANGRMRG